MHFFAAALDTRVLGAGQAKAQRVSENSRVSRCSVCCPYAWCAPGRCPAQRGRSWADARLSLSSAGPTITVSAADAVAGSRAGLLMRISLWFVVGRLVC